MKKNNNSRMNTPDFPLISQRLMHNSRVNYPKKRILEIQWNSTPNFPVTCYLPHILTLAREVESVPLKTASGMLVIRRWNFDMIYIYMRGGVGAGWALSAQLTDHLLMNVISTSQV